jgi:hypothetical protein
MSDSTPPDSSTPKVLAAVVIAAAAATVGYVAQNALVHSEATTAAVYDASMPSPVQPTPEPVVLKQVLTGAQPYTP